MFDVGLKIQCGEWSDAGIKPASIDYHAIDKCVLYWKLKSVKQENNNNSLIPVYLNPDRTELLFTCALPVTVDANLIYKRGVALIANTMEH